MFTKPTCHVDNLEGHDIISSVLRCLIKNGYEQENLEFLDDCFMCQNFAEVIREVIPKYVKIKSQNVSELPRSL